jgi:hypothetical protein
MPRFVSGLTVLTNLTVRTSASTSASSSAGSSAGSSCIVISKPISWQQRIWCQTWVVQK